ncbi:MAG: FKBP-type peptidyl-prolyl cis-trans isomerase, partial [Bacteroidetes bacterium]|nr:FKBP-type peptidyl-prolyl cis-trans isomerase [Bacteroidota bacterium]
MSNCNKKTQPQIDDEIITDYLNKNSLTATKTSTGLYYMITKSSTGVQAQSGNVASVFYTGKFMDDRVFDGNTTSTSTFDFTIGRGQVIQGWDEGVPYMKKGEKARLFIPSHLAYGNL